MDSSARMGSKQWASFKMSPMAPSCNPMKPTRPKPDGSAPGEAEGVGVGEGGELGDAVGDGVGDGVGLGVGAGAPLVRVAFSCQLQAGNGV